MDAHPDKLQFKTNDRHCEERSDEAIHVLLPWIASLRSQ
jgi:hypothetical protein